MHTKTIIVKVENLLNTENLTFSEKLFEICHVLKSEIAHYDWVGFYFAEHNTKTLHLGPFAGEPTDHKVIPFGKGICGQVAESNSTFLVEDVYTQDNYIACNINVKSEIVVPLFINKFNVGQIDIDSNTVNAFSEEDKELLGEINEIISKNILSQKTELKSLWV